MLAALGQVGAGSVLREGDWEFWWLSGADVHRVGFRGQDTLTEMSSGSFFSSWCRQCQIKPCLIDIRADTNLSALCKPTCICIKPFNV